MGSAACEVDSVRRRRPGSHDQGWEILTPRLRTQLLAGLEERLGPTAAVDALYARGRGAHLLACCCQKVSTQVIASFDAVGIAEEWLLFTVLAILRSCLQAQSVQRAWVTNWNNRMRVRMRPQSEW